VKERGERSGAPRRRASEPRGEVEKDEPREDQLQSRQAACVCEVCRRSGQDALGYSRAYASVASMRYAHAA
jgi:hypothetical protein